MKKPQLGMMLIATSQSNLPCSSGKAEQRVMRHARLGKEQVARKYNLQHASSFGISSAST
jgi:hypothetical protein